MKHARRMVMVPEETWEMFLEEKRKRQLLKSNLLDQKRLQNLGAIETLIHEDPRPFREKEHEYNTYLQQSLMLQEQSDKRNAPAPPPPPPPPLAAPVTPGAPPEEKAAEESKIKEDYSLWEEVKATVPKAMTAKALRLMSRIKHHPNLSWNPQGQLEVNGQTQKGTHIVDLVNDLVRHRTKQDPPEGWTTLGHYLATSHTPRELIGNPERWVWMKKREQQEESQAQAREAQWIQERIEKKKAKQQEERLPGGWIPVTPPSTPTRTPTSKKPSSPLFSTPPSSIKKRRTHPPKDKSKSKWSTAQWISY